MMEKRCRECGRVFHAYTRPGKGLGSRRAYKRPSNAVTCSKACSRKYGKRMVALAMAQRAFQARKARRVVDGI